MTSYRAKVKPDENTCMLVGLFYQSGSTSTAPRDSYMSKRVHFCGCKSQTKSPVYAIKIPKMLP